VLVFTITSFRIAPAHYLLIHTIVTPAALYIKPLPQTIAPLTLQSAHITLSPHHPPRKCTKRVTRQAEAAGSSAQPGSPPAGERSRRTGNVSRATSRERTESHAPHGAPRAARTERSAVGRPTRWSSAHGKFVRRSGGARPAEPLEAQHDARVAGDDGGSPGAWLAACRHHRRAPARMERDA